MFSPSLRVSDLKHQSHDGGVMSLFKAVVIVAGGIAILPSSNEEQERLYTRAATATNWTVNFCDRNRDTCGSAESTWATFKKKAEFAGKLAYDVTQLAASSDEKETSWISTESFIPTQLGTLAPEDLEPGWRGDPSRQGT
jgi:hypothetical protein